MMFNNQAHDQLLPVVNPYKNNTNGALSKSDKKKLLARLLVGICSYYGYGQVRDNELCRQLLEGMGVVSSSSMVNNTTGAVSPYDKYGRTPWPKPEGWEEYTYADIRSHFKCREYAYTEASALPTLEDWQLFMDTYKEQVDETATFDDAIPPIPPTEGYTLGNGKPVPYVAGYSSDGKGRGLFAKRNIKKGELIHDIHGDVTFPSGMAWRKFVFNLPRAMACDQIHWTWTQKTDDGSYKIYSAMNIAVLANGALVEGEANVNPESGTSSNAYALRDIKKNEELITDYDVYETRWHDVGL